LGVSPPLEFEEDLRPERRGRHHHPAPALRSVLLPAVVPVLELVPEP